MLSTKFEMPISVTEISNALQNIENGVFRVVRGHPGLSAMSPFDRARTTSYSSLIETIRPSCTVSEL